ncbi:MAG: hypothetical protein AAF902_11095 [Chloroflexota bacterium]
MTVNKKVTVLHFTEKAQPAEAEILTLFGNPVEISHFYCNSDLAKLQNLIHDFSEQSDALALNGVSSRLRYGNRSAIFEPIQSVITTNPSVPICDGSVLQPALERWGVRSAHSIEPGIWANKRILFLPHLNHTGMVETASFYSRKLKSADLKLFIREKFDPRAGILKSVNTSILGNDMPEKDFVAKLVGQSAKELFGETSQDDLDDLKQMLASDFEWADVIAGDSSKIVKYAPKLLSGKTILVPSITPNEVEQLRHRGVEIIVTALPNLSHDINNLARHSCGVIEACLTVISEPTKVPDENYYLNQLSELMWKPTIQYLQPENLTVNRFGYITQPRDISDIREKISVARFLPKAIIDRTAVHIPPVFHGRIENIAADGNEHSAISEVIMLGGTPEEFTAQGADMVARRILRAASMAEQLDARLIGIDTASREVSDALSAIADKTNVALCSGQALTIYAVLKKGIEVANKTSVSQSGGLKATVLNAGDPIISVAAEVLASMVPSITLFGSEPDLLISLKQTIEDIHTEVSVKIGTDPDQTVHKSDLVLLGRASNNKRMTLNLGLFQPGAVICDLSQPSAILEKDLAQRPDLTLIESATFKLAEAPLGKPVGHFPPDIISAPFAEASLLAIKGKFIDFGLVGSLNSRHVYKIRDLALKCGFELNGIVTHGSLVPQVTIEKRRELAQKLSLKLEEITESHSPHYNETLLTEHPNRPSIRRYAKEHSTVLMAGFGILALFAGVASWFFRSRRNTED